jgi:hypothetical protein
VTKKIDRKNFICLMRFRFKMSDGSIVQAWRAFRSYDRIMNDEDREKLRASAKHQTRLDDKFGVGDIVVCLNCFQISNPQMIYPNPAAMLALKYIDEPTMAGVYWRDMEKVN